MSSAISVEDKGKLLKSDETAVVADFVLDTFSQLSTLEKCNNIVINIAYYDVKSKYIETEQLLMQLPFYL